MEPRHGWLFPMMIVAAGSVTVFSCLGIAAITGYVPLSRTGPNPLGDYALPSAVMVSPESDLATPRLAQADVATSGPLATRAPAGARTANPGTVSAPTAVKR
jgi:hypothetical protein